jgi:putative ABC transport system permease protein
MIKNYLKTAIRNLVRYMGFTLINIASLAIGLTGCLIIGLFVWDELQYDRFLKDGENIYRAYTKRSDNNGSNEATANVSPMFATYIKQQYPEVENATRLLMWNGKTLMESGNIKSYEDKGLIADSTFFKMFPLTFLKGDRNTALEGPTSLVITEDLANKYFGNTDPIGKVIKIDKTDAFVKGVLARIPEHFHLDFKYIIPMSGAGLPAKRMENWGWQQFFTYIKVKPGTNINQLQDKFQAAVKKEADSESEKDRFTYKPYLQALKNIHLQSADFIYDNAKRGNEMYVKGLVLIALFVLAIACFNFVNLATARSFRRAKEIGVRKVIGANRSQLLLQFTGETILLSIFSIIIAAIATIIILPALNNFTGKNITFNPITHPIIIPLLLVTGFIVGILAGIYPALVLSGFQPIKVLKGIKLTGDSNAHAWLRQGLVVIQFALSALLIISTIIVFRQINYLHDKDLGFNKDQILFFPVRNDLAKNLKAFKDELKRSPNITSVTAGYGLPGDQLAGDGVTIPGKDGEKTHPATLFIVDADYIKTLGLTIVAGRDFSKDMPTDTSNAFIINETGVKELGMGTPEKALGQRINWDKWIPDSLNPVKKGQVIGVVKDFHYKSLHEKVSTSVLQIYPPVLEKVAVKVKAADVKNTIAYINKTWNKFSPDYPLDYKFMDENFDEMYKSEDKLKTLLSIFTATAILVGCMGLFGLAAFSAEQRTKEIGIRKVLGATVLDIVSMLSKNFLQPVLIASLIAFPVAWWAMNNWLQNFPYRVSISWWVFALAAIVALIIALITVSFQSIKAAVSNPVKSLRTE